MRLKVITPIRVGEKELARRRERYRAVGPSRLEMDLFDLPDGAPESLDSEVSIRESERLVAEEALKTDPGSYDAVLPDCVLDPGLDRLEGESLLPTFGILKLSVGFLAALGHRFASVTRNEPIGEELKARLERYGYLDRFDQNVILDLDFADIADDARWNEVLSEVAERFSSSATTALINGCSAVDLRARPAGVTLVDPTRLALTLLGTAAESGLTPRSREHSLPGG